MRTDPVASRLVITAADFQKFAEFFYRKTGIHFDDSKRYFVDKRLLERIAAPCADGERVADPAPTAPSCSQPPRWGFPAPRHPAAAVVCAAALAAIRDGAAPKGDVFIRFTMSGDAMVETEGVFIDDVLLER